MKLPIVSLTDTELPQETIDALDRMKGDLLIVLVQRLGGTVTLPVEEIDAAGKFMLELQIDQTAREFHFTVTRKQ